MLAEANGRARRQNGDELLQQVFTVPSKVLPGPPIPISDINVIFWQHALDCTAQ